MTLGTVEERAAKMANPEMRAAVKAELDEVRRWTARASCSTSTPDRGRAAQAELDKYTG